MAEPIDYGKAADQLRTARAADVAAMRAEGKSLRAIASTLGVSLDTVWRDAGIAEPRTDADMLAAAEADPGHRRGIVTHSIARKRQEWAATHTVDHNGQVYETGGDAA